MWRGSRGSEWYSFYGEGHPEGDIAKNKPASNQDNSQQPEIHQPPTSKREKKEKRNLTIFLNFIWHSIKYYFVERYKKETDKKTSEVLNSEQFDLELTNFVTKLNNLEKLFLNSDFNNNSLEDDNSRAEFVDEVNNLITQFNEQNQFGISLSDVKDYWQKDKVFSIKSHYQEHIFLINYTVGSGFKAKHPWSL